VIDATCPLATIEKYHENYRQGGVTVIAATVGFGIPQIGTLNFTMHNLGQWFDRLRNNRDKLLHVTSIEDIYTAKRENKLGVIYHFQGSLPFEDNLIPFNHIVPPYGFLFQFINITAEYIVSRIELPVFLFYKQRGKPYLSGSFGLITNWCVPVINALDIISGTTAGRSPTIVSFMSLPMNVVPIMLSFT